MGPLSRRERLLGKPLLAAGGDPKPRSLFQRTRTVDGLIARQAAEALQASLTSPGRQQGRLKPRAHRLAGSRGASSLARIPPVRRAKPIHPPQSAKVFLFRAPPGQGLVHRGGYAALSGSSSGHEGKHPVVRASVDSDAALPGLSSGSGHGGFLDKCGASSGSVGRSGAMRYHGADRGKR